MGFFGEILILGHTQIFMVIEGTPLITIRFPQKNPLYKAAFPWVGGGMVGGLLGTSSHLLLYVVF